MCALRIEPQCLIEVLDCPVKLLLKYMDYAAIEVCHFLVWIEFDGPVEIGERLLVGLRNAVGETTRCKAARPNLDLKSAMLILRSAHWLDRRRAILKHPFVG